ARVVVSPLAEGSGTVRTRHGILPVPVPAVTHIVTEAGLVLSQSPIRGELVTPTGAAIAAAIRTDESLPRAYRIEKVGFGGGKREYDPPSMVRAMWIDDQASTAGPVCSGSPGGSDSCVSRESAAVRQGEESDFIWKLETDIDDCTGEELGYVMERLYAAGAREVHFAPIFMKKNRPAYELTVITTEDKRAELEGILFKETTTIGIRRQEMARTILPREEVVVTTPYGEVQAKKVILPDGEERVYPEYESVKKLAEEKHVPIREIVGGTDVTMGSITA
ncbi:MAG: LarC family nickel insertion protein, partial [Eubacterium sp.]|nr:LarC family nickel insertion protein [Eubacterium sp.]